MAFVEDRADLAYAVPRLPAPMTRTRGAFVKVCFPTAFRKASSELAVGMASELCVTDGGALEEGVNDMRPSSFLNVDVVGCINLSEVCVAWLVFALVDLVAGYCSDIDQALWEVLYSPRGASSF